MANMTPRGQRVADQIQRELATLIQLEVSDPRVGMVSVTGVDVSRDLAHARVFVTVLNTPSASDEANDALSSPGDLDKLEVEENLKALNQAAGFLRASRTARSCRASSTARLRPIWPSMATICLPTIIAKRGAQKAKRATHTRHCRVG